MRPFYVYDNWSAYDELSDNIPLTSELALFQLDHMRRWMEQGVKFDAYLMDAFWYEPAGGYREWRRDRWPDGPGKWLDECAQAGLLPGLWFPANTAFTLDIPADWASSLDANGWGFCCFEGGFLEGFVDILKHWYGQGIRVFKFDFADFSAAPESKKLQLLPSEIRSRNIAAYRAALLEFRASCPEAKLMAYNGFEEAEFMTWTDRPIRRTIDPTWLEVFDSIYCGDPRPADLPLPSFWRTLDVYADHETRALELGGLPLPKIDNCAMMIGRAGTCYWRGDADWKSTCLLSYARRGNFHVTMGNLEAISDEDARWIAAVQALYEASGTPEFWGGIPGKAEPYGYQAGRLSTFVNPGLATWELKTEGHVVYADGATPVPGSALLGAGAVVVIGPETLDLGTSPATLMQPFEASWEVSGRTAETEIDAGPGKVHFGFSQFDKADLAVRSSQGTDGELAKSGQLLKLSAWADGEPVALELTHDTLIWSGVSWAFATISLEQSTRLRLRAEATDPNVISIRPFLYQSS